MDNVIVAALITALAAVICALISAVLSRRKNERRTTPDMIPIPPPSQVEQPITDKDKKSDYKELEGVRRILQERVLKRVSGQLDPMVRRFETIEAVEKGCETLVKKIQNDRFIPEIIIGWKDEEGNYQGSETVMNIISSKIGLKGMKNHIILMREVSERREVSEKCDWFGNTKKALIVDDACYSGSTFKYIKEKLSEISPKADIRFAVLSTKDPDILNNLYFVSTHNSEELLFPWGWSRLIVGFYDLYKLFGITDMHTVRRKETGWGTTATLVENIIGNVKILSIESNKEMHLDSNRRFDSFLYFLNGSADIHVGDKSGSFKKGQYIFIPRLIGFIVKTSSTVSIIDIELFSSVVLGEI